VAIQVEEQSYVGLRNYVFGDRIDRWGIGIWSRRRHGIWSGKDFLLCVPCTCDYFASEWPKNQRQLTRRVQPLAGSIFYDRWNLFPQISRGIEMNKALLVPTFTLIGICVGCNTGPEDVQKAESNYQEAQLDADQMVTDARQDGVDGIHETRKVVQDDIAAESRDIQEALRDGKSTVAEERADLDKAVRHGEKELTEAEVVREKEIVDAKTAADEKVADAKRELTETTQKAIEDGQDRVEKCEEKLSKQEQQLSDATAEVAAAESRLKDANDDSRAKLQTELDDAKKAEQKEQSDVIEAKAELAKEQASLKKIESKTE